MALYKHGKYWWVSMYRNKIHLQMNTKLKDKHMARAVEQALKLAGTALDGTGKRLMIPAQKDEGKQREIITGLLRAVYGEDRDRTRLEALWPEYEDFLKVRCKQLEHKTLLEKKHTMERFVLWAKERNIETLDGVTADVAKKYSVGFVSKVSDKRRANIMGDLSSIWSAVLAAHPGMINPWPSVAPAKDINSTSRGAFTAEEEQRVLEAAKTVHPQWFVACVIARNTGLRYGDVCRLTRQNLDMERGFVNAKPHKTANSSGVTVAIPMTSELKATLAEWLNEHPRLTDNDTLLDYLREYGMAKRRPFREVLVAAGLDPKQYSFHTWRITLATKMAKCGAPTEARMKILGHTSVEMAKHYNKYGYEEELSGLLERASVA